MHMLCACLHKTHIHTYIRTHSVSGDTRLSKLLTKNQGFASCIKYRHFARSTPKFVHGRNSTSIRLAYPQMQGFVPYFCPIALQSSIKNLLHCIDKVWGITNLGHKAGGAFSGQKAEWVWSRSWNLGHNAGGEFSGQKVLTIECSLMSGCGQGHETLDTKLEEHSLVRGLSRCGQGHEVLLQSHETKSGMESLGLSYISCFFKQMLQPKVSLVAKRHWWIKQPWPL